MVMKKYFTSELVFRFEKAAYFLFHFRAAGGILVLYSVYAFAVTQSSILLYSLLVVVGLVVVFSKERMESNLKSLQYRNAFSLFGLSRGKWVDLPEIEYVSIFPTQLGQSVNSVQTGLVTSTVFKEIRINLIFNKNRRLHVFSSKKLDEIKDVAMQFGNHLDIGVYDCTGAENVWLRRGPV